MKTKMSAMVKNLLLASALLSACALFAPNAMAITDVLYPSDDAMVDHKDPDKNTGSHDEMKVRNEYGDNGSSGWEWSSLVRFDLSYYPQGVIIKSATLKLYYWDWKDNDPAGNDLTLYRLKEKWSESTVTWNNQPSHHSVYTDKDTVPSDTGAWMAWDVTDDVQDMLDGKISNYGWILRDLNYWGMLDIPISYFRTKEYANHKPRLEIEYDALMARPLTLSASVGGVVDFALFPGDDYMYRNYHMLGSMTGTSPGTPLPGGTVLPLNFDVFTMMTFDLANTPVFLNFRDFLDSKGFATAQFNTFGPVPLPGAKFYFAYTLFNPFGYVSNPVTITILP